jgi:pimeloyl-ACP methyl ester carboxylesterase
LEFGSNRWSCQPYCDPLLQAGYDIFAFEPRNQGQSQAMPGYEPLHWLTSYEVADTLAAIHYLKKRPDADPKGIGFFGISRGANAGLIAAARDRSVRCLVTDGAFGTYSTMIPYMRKWVALYNQNYLAHGLLPSWFYHMMATAGMRKVQRQRHVRFEHVENAMPRLKRPLLMIHGGDDTYIKVETAREPFKRAKGPKTFWVVPKAKHNQAIHIAGPEYAEKVVGFFNFHLGGLEPGIERVTVPPEPLDKLPNLSTNEAVALLRS